MTTPGRGGMGVVWRQALDHTPVWAIAQVSGPELGLGQWRAEVRVTYQDMLLSGLLHQK